MFHVEEKGCEGERFVVGVRQLSLLRLASQLGHLERFLRLCSGDTGTRYRALSFNKLTRKHK